METATATETVVATLGMIPLGSTLRESSRGSFALNCIEVSADPLGYRLTGTDGKQLASVLVITTGPTYKGPTFLVSAKAIADAAGDASNPTLILSRENVVRKAARGCRERTVANGAEGHFPPHEDARPKKTAPIGARIVVRVAVLAELVSLGEALLWTIEKSKVTLTRRLPESGADVRVSLSLDAAAYLSRGKESSSHAVGFNPRILHRAAQSIAGDAGEVSVLFGETDCHAAVLLPGPNARERDYSGSFALAMPVNLK